MKKFLPLIGVLLVTVGLVALGWWLLKDAHMDVLTPRGEVAAQQKQILMFALILSALVVIPVFIMLGIFAWRFREGNKKATYRPHWNSSRKLEMLWWGIPIAIIIVLGAVTWYTSHSLDPYKKLSSDQPTLEVQVIALQWKWLFLYPDENVATLNQLVIPADRPVHFTLSADAPMSAFWVPSLGSQIYAMNGMSSQLNLIANDTGNYRGYGTNINGKGYADMTFTVHAKTNAQYETWLRGAKKSDTSFTMEKYHQVSKPKSDRKERVYRLTDGDLYDKIMMMHMMGSHTGDNT